MREITVAAVQVAMSWDLPGNLDAAEAAVGDAAARGAQVILLPELFATPYFCVTQNSSHADLARPRGDDPLLARFGALAARLGVVLPVSHFERDGQALFNSLTVFDADGAAVAHYRKSHIPQNPGYEEKFYFSPGDTGFVVADTRFGRLGCGICWDQWFPETARCLALMGAELLLFPTAIGSEPADPAADTAGHWRRTMQGHAAANLTPLVAANRFGDEGRVTFYGTSFIADETGAIVADAPRGAPAVLTARFDLDAVARRRTGWGVFRDRRPDLYGRLARL